MPVIIHPAIEVSAYRKMQESSTEEVKTFFQKDSSFISHRGDSVKKILDELFSKLFKPVASGWQKFLDSGDFIVPEDVTRVLVLCIAAGSSTTSSMGGGTFVSRIVAVTPGETIPIVVGKPQPKGTVVKTQLQSSFNGTTLLSDYQGKYTVDGQEYAYDNGQEPTFPPELDGAQMITVARQKYINPGYVSAGSGGYAVAADVPDERAAWLELARDMSPGTVPSGRKCYPDETQMGTASSGAKAGDGANYGGSAGRYSTGEGYSYNAGTGGDGLVCVFWGDDIYPKEQTSAPSPSFFRKDSSSTLSPIYVSARSKDIEYTNPEVGFGGTTVEEALDELLAMATPS